MPDTPTYARDKQVIHRWRTVVVGSTEANALTTGTLAAAKLTPHYVRPTSPQIRGCSSKMLNSAIISICSNLQTKEP